MAESFIISNKNDWTLLLEKAENGNSDAMIEVAFNYENGLTINDVEIVEVNLKLAFEWTKKSYEKGNIEGMINYANYLSDGDYIYVEKNIDLAMKLYEEAMNKGNLHAAHCLAIEYRNKQNYKKAFELYLKSNHSNEFYPELSVGLCYYFGIGVSKDKLKAFEIFKTINSENNSQYEIDEANYLIGKIYLEGEIVTQSIETARHYLELADKDGDHRSAQELLLIIGRKKLIN